MQAKKKLVIVGCGFAGIQLVKTIDARYFDVLLIDKLNHHQFQPLFYQVATSQIEPSNISFPIRNIIKNKKHVRFRLATVKRVDSANNKIETNIGDFDYDILVMAMGCRTNFFGNADIAKHALTLKTSYEAITIRNHILLTFEKIISAKEEEKEALMNLVIVGAGPTGVELSGAFAEIRKNILPRDYPRIDFSNFRIILVEGSKNTLNSMSETAKKASRKYLEQMGIEVLTETFVNNYDGETLQLSNGEVIKTKSVIWAAGVIANRIEGLNEEFYTRANRLIVDRYNKIKGSQNIYALGDIAYMETPNFPNGHPQVANVAINQAKNLAYNLKNEIRNKNLREYEYRDLGSMATIGTNKAVVDLPFVHFKGHLAWAVWMFLHLMLILSVRNKLLIFINWAWAYITKDTSLRLILINTDNK